MLSIRWISELSDKIKQEFFQAKAVLKLMYGWTNLSFTSRKKQDRNYTKT